MSGIQLLGRAYRPRRAKAGRALPKQKGKHRETGEELPQSQPCLRCGSGDEPEADPLLERLRFRSNEARQGSSLKQQGGPEAQYAFHSGRNALKNPQADRSGIEGIHPTGALLEGREETQVLSRRTESGIATVLVEGHGGAEGRASSTEWCEKRLARSKDERISRGNEYPPRDFQS